MRAELFPWAATPLPCEEGVPGVDIRAAEGFFVPPNDTFIVHTGVCVSIPENHFGMLVTNARTARKGLTLEGCSRIIGSEFREEIILTMRNLTTDETIWIGPGGRLCSLVVCPCISFQMEIGTK